MFALKVTLLQMWKMYEIGQIASSAVTQGLSCSVPSQIDITTLT